MPSLAAMPIHCRRRRLGHGAPPPVLARACTASGVALRMLRRTGGRRPGRSSVLTPDSDGDTRDFHPLDVHRRFFSIARMRTVATWRPCWEPLGLLPTLGQLGMVHRISGRGHRLEGTTCGQQLRAPVREPPEQGLRITKESRSAVSTVRLPLLRLGLMNRSGPAATSPGYQEAVRPPRGGHRVRGSPEKTPRLVLVHPPPPKVVATRA